MGGRIDAYVDVASFFSYVAFHELRQNLETLQSHGVTVEFHPVLIAAINNLSGNKPPWVVPAKGKYLAIDSRRAAERVGLTNLKTPEDFVKRALTVSTQRALHFVKQHYSHEILVATTATLMAKFWTPPHVNLTIDENLAQVLREVTDGGEQGNRVFTQDDVERIMKGREEMKERLKNTTQKAVELGAFGAPWLWVTNDSGKSQPFFGSDRFNHVYEFLGVPHQDVALLPPSKL
ncbi:Dihydrofolate reductase-like protein [Emericellopsis cladophorae]|uniref:Glutathione S-transferase kappa n=1 Tax=Emericellopsis cladophorae TaxID=2686198 RepID=A0A9P9Y5L8_9HYPO|nr:Dihydrofolate reductase-like protein [Emericellopsis cladophorae]KAI6783856.1 Dihydrofolate reductase-like protein [Emericellopsis cladophorae]